MTSAWPWIPALLVSAAASGLWPSPVGAQSAGFPPTITLTPIPPAETTSDVVLLRGKISHFAGVGGYRLYHNHRLEVAREQAPRREISFLHPMRLRQEGPNVIEIIPIDAGGNLLSTRHVVAVNYQRPPPRVWALVAGVNTHKAAAPKHRRCDYCERDAQDYAAKLTQRVLRRYAADQVRILRLLGAEATTDRIRTELREFVRQSRADDVVILYFAGQGTTTVEGRGLTGVTHHLLSHDADPARLTFTALSVASLGDLLAGARGRVYALLDTSFAWRDGETPSRTVAIHRSLTDVDRRNIRTKLAANRWLEELSPGGTVHVLAASRGLEGAEESDQLRHGVFTNYLLEILEGKGDVNNDGRIDFDEAFTYIHERVSRDTNDNQHPVRLSSTRRSPLTLMALPTRLGPKVTLEPLEPLTPGDAPPIATTLKGRLEAQSGVSEYILELNGVAVRRRAVSGAPPTFAFTESIYLESYGNRITVVVRDTQGLEARESTTVINAPTRPVTPVLWSAFFPQNRLDDNTPPPLPRIRHLRHDVQKLVDDFRQLAQRKLVTAEQTRRVEEFWDEVLVRLALLLAAAPEERGRWWGDVRKKLLEQQVRLEINSLDRLRGLWTEEGELVITAAVATKEPDGGRSRYWLHVNGAPLLIEDFDHKPQLFRHRIGLHDGTNDVVVGVETPLGLSATVTFNVLRQPMRDVSALVVGISRYSNNRTLDHARQDAEAVARHLMTRTPLQRDRLVALYDAEATNLGLTEAVERLKAAAAAAPIETLLIYFSGLGVLGEDGEPYLMPHDGDARRLAETAVPLRDFMELVNRQLRPADALLVLDTSFAPPTEAPPLGFRNKAISAPVAVSQSQAQQMVKGGSRYVEPAVRLEEALTAPPNWAVVVAGVQEALEPVRGGESTGLANSLFTQHFLETLADLNRDGVVDVADLSRPVALDLFDVFERTEAKVRAQSGSRQRAYLTGNLQRPFTFQYVPPGDLYRKARSILDQYTRPRVFVELTPDAAFRVRKLLEKAVDLGDREPETLAWLGYLDSAERRLAMADERLKNALSLARSETERAAFYELWASMHVQRGDYFRASELYDEAGKLDPARKATRVESAYNLARGGRQAEALQSLESLAQDPAMGEEPSVLDTLYLRIADVTLQTGDFKKAGHYYSFAMRVGAATQIIMDRLAWAAFAHRFWNVADEAAKNSYVDETSLQLLRFFALRFAGKADEAKTVLRRRPPPEDRRPTERIVSFVLGHITYDAMMDDLGADPVLHGKANFYAAMVAATEGRTADAAELLEQVVATNMRHTPEWVAAFMMPRIPAP